MDKKFVFPLFTPLLKIVFRNTVSQHAICHPPRSVADQIPNNIKIPISKLYCNFPSIFYHLTVHGKRFASLPLFSPV
jgi:hypothetical protein